MPAPLFKGDYAKDGKSVRANARAEAGYRCIRCGHPYETGLKRDDRGEWSDCDDQCTHAGKLRVSWNFPYTAWEHTFRMEDHVVKDILVSFRHKYPNMVIQSHWRILTVHHFDGDKSNDRWWNLLSLCQKCHLSIQNKVNPEIPYMFEHSDWLKPYVAGFYAFKYLGKELTREEVQDRLVELLLLERKA